MPRKSAVRRTIQLGPAGGAAPTEYPRGSHGVAAIRRRIIRAVKVRRRRDRGDRRRRRRGGRADRERDGDGAREDLLAVAGPFRDDGLGLFVDGGVRHGVVEFLPAGSAASRDRGVLSRLAIAGSRLATAGRGRSISWRGGRTRPRWGSLPIRSTKKRRPPRPRTLAERQFLWRSASLVAAAGRGGHSVSAAHDERGGIGRHLTTNAQKLGQGDGDRMASRRSNAENESGRGRWRCVW